MNTRNKMPRNTTGGSGHKSRANSEGNVTKKNRGLIEAYLDDIEKDGECEDVFIGKVIKKLGDGRVELNYSNGGKMLSAQAVIKGSLRGRGKSQAFIDSGTIVMFSYTGLVGSLAYEIMAVVPAIGTPLRKRFDDVVTLEFISTNAESGGGFEFDNIEEEDAGVDVDKI